MSDRFKDVEEKFNRLKREFGEKRISQTEFVDSLRGLRIKDGEGRFWMIGVQTGKWYFHDGAEWIPGRPPSLEERKVICISCGFENDLEAEVCARCGSFSSPDEGILACPRCGRELEQPFATCPECDRLPDDRTSGGSGPGELSALPGPEEDLVVKSVTAASSLWLFGVLGLFGGLVLGLAVGVTGVFPGIVEALPGFFKDIQGTLHGGIVFTVLGGILGFAAGGAGGFLLAAAVNAILSFTGGLRIQAERGRRRE